MHRSSFRLSAAFLFFSVFTRPFAFPELRKTRKALRKRCEIGFGSFIRGANNGGGFGQNGDEARFILGRSRSIGDLNRWFFESVPRKLVQVRNLGIWYISMHYDGWHLLLLKAPTVMMITFIIIITGINLTSEINGQNSNSFFLLPRTW